MKRPSGTRCLARLSVWVLAMVILHVSGPLVSADDARVLPRGVTRVGIEGQYFLPVDKRFNPDGDTEDAAIDYNVSLNSQVFPALALFDPFVGGMASFGDTKVSFDYDVRILNVDLAYGLTDRLTVGIHVPYWWVKNTVKARLDSGPGSSANVGLNPFPRAAGQPPFIPIAAGGVPLSTEDVQQLLGPGLAGISGFGFKRFETFSGDGFGDVEAGFRYQYLRTDDWQLAFTGGARFPTGRVDDPDNLTDVGFGNGAYALLFRFHNDYTVSNLWKNPAARGTPDSPAQGTLVLNGTVRYDLYLPDREVKRVPEDVNQPITANEENVERDLGDVIELEVSGKYTLLEGVTLSGLYKFGFAFKDDVTSRRGLPTQGLEDETDFTEHILIVGLSYSTLPLYLKNKFPVPLTASLAYRNRFAGTNNVFKAQYISLALDVLF